MFLHSYTSIVVDLFCLASVIAIYFRINRSVGTNFEVWLLKGVLVMFGLFLIFNTLWALQQCEYINLSKKVFDHLVLLNILGVTIETSFWCAYPLVRFNGRDSFNKKEMALLLTPVILQLLMVIITAHFKVFSFEDGSLNFKVCNYIYFISSIYYYGIFSVQFVKTLRSSSSKAYKKHLWKLVLMAQPAVIGLILEYIFPVQFLIPMCFYFSIFLFFLSLQDSHIYTDSLTGVYNRRRFDLYKEQMQPLLSNDNKLYVFLIDIDDFKAVNDTYGHLKGDQVLKGLGESLLDLRIKYHVFVGRIGGDEFVISVPYNYIEDPHAFMSDVLDTTKRQWNQYNFDFEPSCSIGYTVCSNSHIPIEESMMRADIMMYEYKEKHHDRRNVRK